MTYQTFLDSLQQATPPDTYPILLKALWYDAKGDWESAHNIAQQKEGTPTYDRIHAYLHRVEGDAWNAAYWYRRVGIAMPDCSFDEEREQLLRAYLD